MNVLYASTGFEWCAKVTHSQFYDFVDDGFCSCDKVKHIKIPIKCHKKHSSVCQSDSVCLLWQCWQFHLSQLKVSLSPCLCSR